MEEEIVQYMAKIQEEGGVLEAIKKGFFVREVTEAALKRLSQIEAGEKIVVGQNTFVLEEEVPLEVFRIDPRYEEEQRARLEMFKQKRNVEGVNRALDDLRKTVGRVENLMPSMIEAVKAQATLGEICRVLRELYGEYRPY